MTSLPDDNDPELQALTVKAESIAARVRTHYRWCDVCSASRGAPTLACDDREHLEDLLKAALALVKARRRALGLA